VCGFGDTKLEIHLAYVCQWRPSLFLSFLLVPILHHGDGKKPMTDESDMSGSQGTEVSTISSGKVSPN
jgi:hypothetical protein